MTGMPFVNNRYQLVQCIGHGSMGQVFKAIDTQLDRPVALKQSFVEDATQKITLREAKTLASMDHLNIMKIFDVFSENGALWLVSEWIDGKDAGQLTLPLGPLSLMSLCAQVLDALPVLHGKGVVHRDVKPSNIMVDRNGVLKLIDFGAAFDPLASSGKTVAGSFDYIDPQILAGYEASARSDYYSLAISLLELGSGRSVWPALAPLPLYEYIRKNLLKRTNELASGLPPVLAQFIRECMGSEGMFDERALEFGALMRSQLLFWTGNSAEKQFVKSMESGKSELNDEIRGSIESFANKKFQEGALNFRSEADWLSFLKSNEMKAAIPKRSSRLSKLRVCVVLILVLGLIPNSVFQNQNNSQRTFSSARNHKAIELTQKMRVKSQEKKVVDSGGLLPVVNSQVSKVVNSEVEVYLNTNAWADVFIDEKPRGRVPSRKAIKLTPGEHKIRLISPFVKEFITTVKVPDVKKWRKRIDLQKTTKKIVVDLSADSVLYVNGKRVGEGPRQVLDLQFGRHLFTARRNGKESVRQKINVAPGQQAVVRLF